MKTEKLKMYKSLKTVLGGCANHSKTPNLGNDIMGVNIHIFKKGAYCTIHVHMGCKSTVCLYIQVGYIIKEVKWNGIVTSY